jgi:hypothetical protein
MGAVREIMKFYYRKGERGLQVTSLPSGVEALCEGKKGNFLGQFYSILNLEVGRRHTSFPVSNGLWERGGSGQTHAYTYTNSQVP